MSTEESWDEERARLRSLVDDLPPREFEIYRPNATLRITLATPAEAVLVHEIMRDAFENLEALDPPSGALRETVEEVEAAILRDGAVLGWIEGEAVASARFKLQPDQLYVGRLAVRPAHQGRAIGTALMRQMELIARLTERPKLGLGTRMQLTRNVSMYEGLGYHVVKMDPHPQGKDTLAWLEKNTPVPDESQ